MSDVNPMGTSVQEAADQLAGLLDAESDVSEETEEVSEVEETEEPEAEERDETEASEVEDEAEPEEPEPETFQTLTDFAEALEMDEESFFQSIRTKVKVGGEEKEVTLAELKAGYQMESDYRRKTAELSEQRKALEAERQEEAEARQQRAVEQAATMNAMEQMLIAEINSDEMAQLRKTNESAWLARRMEFQDKAQKLSNARQEAAQRYEQQRLAERQEIQRREREALQSKIEVNDTTTQEILSAAKSLGIEPQEFENLLDHRFYVGLHRLHQLEAENKQLREKMESAELVTKKVRNLPKLQKPGKPRTEKQQRSDQELALRNKLRASGRVEDAAKLLEMRMNRG